MAHETNVKTYGSTLNERLLNEKQASRQIVNEMLDFGISERQKYQIIKLLAENLENFEHMKTLCDFIDDMTTTDIGDITNMKKLSLERIVGSVSGEEHSNG